MYSIEMLFEIQMPRLFYFKSHFDTEEVILQQTRYRVLHFLNIIHKLNGFDWKALLFNPRKELFIFIICSLGLTSDLTCTHTEI